MENLRRPGNYRPINDSYRQSREVASTPQVPDPKAGPDLADKATVAPKKDTDVKYGPQ